MHPYLTPLTQLFQAHADEGNAVPMAKYMRDHFPFLGIKTPVRRGLFKEFHNQEGLPENPELEGIIRDLWDLPHREYQYVALDLLLKVKKQWEPGLVILTRDLIVTKSWWDTVDGLASNVIGPLFSRFPDLRDPHIAAWRHDENIWLRRTTLLFQLNFKEKTDETLLFDLISDNTGSDEFFIQKAIGWALREYSKTNPHAVKDFTDHAPLAPLSHREALKWLKSHQSGST